MLKWNDKGEMITKIRNFNETYFNLLIVSMRCLPSDRVTPCLQAAVQVKWLIGIVKEGNEVSGRVSEIDP